MYATQKTKLNKSPWTTIQDFLDLFADSRLIVLYYLGAPLERLGWSAFANVGI